MTESPREQAFGALADLLETMTGARHWGGSYPNRVKIVREFVAPVQELEFPVIALEDGTGSALAFGSTGGVGRFVDEYVITLHGYIRGNDQVSPRQWAERLRYDCFLTLVRATVPIGQLRNFNFERPQEAVEHTDKLGMFVWPIVCILDDEVQAG